MNGNYYGLPTNSIGNKHLTLEFLSQAGPRLVRLFLQGSNENLLQELPELRVDTPYGVYFFRGGHRLWHSPEGLPRSYIPDNEGLVVEHTDQGVRLTGPVEPGTFIQKIIEITLHPDRPSATLLHRLRNNGIWPVELAPWAITQVPLGGTAVLPQMTSPLDKAGLLPNRQFALWPYSRWGDERLQLYDDIILVQGNAKTPPIKIGYANRAGWIGYLNKGVFFCKRSAFQAEANYPDYGSNSECYCDNRFLELETLGPLVNLEPGQSTEHVETWEIYAAEGVPATRAGIGELVRGLGL